LIRTKGLSNISNQIRMLSNQEATVLSKARYYCIF